MKKSNLIYLLGAVLAVSLSAGLWAQNTESKPQRGNNRQAWEHLALENAGAGIKGSQDLARKINGLGDEGWELVDVETIIEDGTTNKTVYFFKRP